MSLTDQLAADVDHVACPLEPCAAYVDGEELKPGTPCTNVFTGQTMPVPHWQRIRAAQEKP